MSVDTEQVQQKEYSFYNQSVKESFLDNYQGESRNTYARLFVISKEIEEEFEKDVYDFNLRLLEILFNKCKPLTLASSKHNGHVISAYMKWAINKGLRDNQTNPLDNVNKVWYEKFVNKEVELYISEQEITKIEKDLNNYQDKIIPRALFEGLSVSELLNLHKNHINFNTRTLVLYDDLGNEETKRTLQVSQRLMDYIRSALSEPDYLKNNGDLSPDIKTRYTSLVPPNGFVIRSSVTKNDSFNDPAKIHTIYRRLQMIAKQWGKPYFNSTNISRSGMLKKAHELLMEHNQLEKPQYDEICKQFNVPKVLNGGVKLEYNYYPLKEFLNEDMVRKLYS